jgi:hypothetical protein
LDERQRAALFARWPAPPLDFMNIESLQSQLGRMQMPSAEHTELAPGVA